MVKSDLIKKFEKLSMDDKIDFIEDYDIVNDLSNRPYFIKFIKNNSNSKDYWFSSILIELASEIRVDDLELFNTYFKFLFESKHYFIKLSVLDFQIETYDIYYDKFKNTYHKLEEILDKKNERLIVKNQILLNLMIYSKEKRLKYLYQLLDNLKRTSDYRSHLRVYNTFINYNYYNFITPDFLEQLFSISEKKRLGKSVSEKIRELKSSDIYGNVSN
ncbi:hypothetical protein CJ739_1213 [Mariniflexile rhizosphaerae]|uniref:hypothetical protein n=1 Tax=unclassified Mariniflexile TaxID=2643887 RepID=UPI000CACF259|nr:hypothetical protein [Mariniflexile sp. TRM1-10]AXP80304.1 hypothetical protein CJ739_1213 [Mariniflexile sp. TRM1-10]PLB20676.1 MAG: hypothetical protein TRG1_658 [Flavobacteriaceae bacterium FS1-H7996/R]